MEFYLEDSRTVLQMEFLYTGNGMLIRENELSKRKRFNLTQITIPLVFKFEAKEDLYFSGGNYFGRILTAQELNSLGQTSNIKDRFQLFDLGFLLGFEFKVNQRLSFDLRYNYGLLNFNNADAYEGSETERLYKNRTVNYGMVYKF
jgi:opacity protein-like surface antigen